MACSQKLSAWPSTPNPYRRKNFEDHLADTTSKQRYGRPGTAHGYNHAVEPAIGNELTTAQISEKQPAFAAVAVGFDPEPSLIRHKPTFGGTAGMRQATLHNNGGGLPGGGEKRYSATLHAFHSIPPRPLAIHVARNTRQQRFAALLGILGNIECGLALSQ